MKFISIFLFIAYSFVTQAQDDGRYTEDEIAFQQDFIAARQLMLIENYPKALDAFDLLYKKDRSNAAVCFELARLNAIQSNEDDAVKFAENAIRLEPDNEWFQIFYANLMMEKNEYQKAIGSLEYLNSHFSDNPDYYDQLAFAYLADKQFDKAIFVLNNQETRLGISDSIIMKMFEIYHKSGKPQDAIFQLERVISRNVGDTEVLNKLASYYLDNGMNEKAMETYRRILQIDPNDTRANVAVLGNPDDPSDQNVYLRTLIPLIKNTHIPLDAKLNELIPYVEKLAENYDTELAQSLDEVTRNLILVHANEAKAYAIRGDVLFMGKNLHGAIDVYKKTLERNDKVFTVWEQLMYALQWENNYEELAKVSMDAIDLFPNQGIGYVLNARANVYLGKYNDATNILEEASLIAGRNMFLKSEIASVKGRLNLEKGDLIAAETLTKESLELSGNKNPNALEVMGDILFKKGEKGKALDNWNKAVQNGNLSSALANKIEQKQIIE